jgi:hypothetical protein
MLRSKNSILAIALLWISIGHAQTQNTPQQPDKKGNVSVTGHQYQVNYLSESENIYEGNIIISIFDSNNNELTGAKLTLFSEDQKIGELELGTSSNGVFFKEQKVFHLEVSRKGYADFKTGIIQLFPDKACLIRVHLNNR